MHARLRNWYSHTLLLPSLTPKNINITTSHTPQQQEGWSCALHMLLEFLSAIYQGTVPIIQYIQRHAYQLSRMLIRYVITGELTPWIDKIRTYLSDPLNKADPEPHSKHYIAWGTELLNRQHLE